MSLSATIRRGCLAIALLSLIGLTWTGVIGGVRQLSESDTPWQKLQTATQLAYGAFALLSAVTTVLARRWARATRAGFTVSLTCAGGLASVVWGGSSVPLGILAGAGTMVVALGIIWALGSEAPGHG